MDARIEGETGFTRCGILYLCDTDEQLAAKANGSRRMRSPPGFPPA